MAEYPGRNRNALQVLNTNSFHTLTRLGATGMPSATFPKTRMKRFQDRQDAGKQLAVALEHYHLAAETIVVGLPRGGVVVAAVIAERLGLPLDVLPVRKLGTPSNPELAFGAIASGGGKAIVQTVWNFAQLTAQSSQAIETLAKAELHERENLYWKNFPPISQTRRTILLVDDGLATGATMRAAIDSVRQNKPKEIAVAVPVGASETVVEIGKSVDEIICLITPPNFSSVGGWFNNFPQSEHEEVVFLLKQARARQASP